jgi:hypothetical protein
LEIRNDQKGIAGFISATTKGIIWHDEERPAILLETHQGAKGNGFLWPHAN